MSNNELLELINQVECSAGQRTLYYFSHHRLIKLAINYFKDSDVIVVDSKTGKRYQRGATIRREQNGNG